MGGRGAALPGSSKRVLRVPCPHPRSDEDRRPLARLRKPMTGRLTMTGRSSLVPGGGVLCLCLIRPPRLLWMLPRSKRGDRRREWTPDFRVSVIRAETRPAALGPLRLGGGRVRHLGAVEESRVALCFALWLVSPCNWRWRQWAATQVRNGHQSGQNGLLARGAHSRPIFSCVEYCCFAGCCASRGSMSIGCFVGLVVD